ncbi:NAD(P)H-dependent oxidoreductase [Roseomonas sp. BN140053]|uniref:NAD(P)H-dependent oxidoreductase n=1 Tax=Roseomonas sp. BN140053 TaxID=3391898 RepID=UPI0039E9DF45
MPFALGGVHRGLERLGVKVAQFHVVAHPLQGGGNAVAQRRAEAVGAGMAINQEDAHVGQHHSARREAAQRPGGDAALMRVHYLYAHPLPDSFHAAIRDAALEGLRAAGHEVDLCDLYAEGFDPVLGVEERRDYHDPALNRERVGPYVERLQRADALVLSFPTWCFGMPAILKGWFDRTMIPGVSFNLIDGKATPALTHIRKVAGISTYGRPRWTALVMADPPRKVVTRYFRMVSGGRSRVEYHAMYDMNRATPARCGAFLEQVRRRMSGF